VRETIASLKDMDPDSEHGKRQRDDIARVLMKCNGRIGGPDGAAKHMGLNRTTLISRIEKLGINPHDYS
jgi:formate hydrogenlyase transcriptional activator